MRVLGIMSGTSLGGVDYVVCSIKSPTQIRFEDHWAVAFPERLGTSLRRAAQNEATAYEIGNLHHELGRFYAAGAGSTRVDLVGLHGQTVFHNPANATLQLGEPAYLAERLRVPVVSNFRAADIAAGGEGAPLATIFHHQVFAQKGRHIAVNNLGGISNVTSVDWRGRRKPRTIAFDTGPANILIDAAARHTTRGKHSFDRDGIRASNGKVDEVLLAKLLKNRYFRRPPPKSTGRELFGEALLKLILKRRLTSNDDLLATLTELTARSIALNYRLHLGSFPDEVILCGGGALNPFLYARIASALREIRSDIAIHSSADFGWHPQVIEAAAFALLAWLTWNRRPGNIPETTGARGPRVLGQMALPSAKLQQSRKE
jgi:anhydro-N-acetylmuramic acid kinase